MKAVGVALGVNSIVCRVDSTGGVRFRSKCDCSKPGEKKNADHFSEPQNNRCDRVRERGTLTVILAMLRFALTVRGHA